MTNNNKFNSTNSKNSTNTKNNLLKDSLHLVNNTNNIGLNIQTELEEQNDVLKKSNELLESTEYICNESFRVMRNMTFSGKLLNLLYSEPLYLTDYNKNIKEKNNTNTSIELNDKNINNIIEKKDKFNEFNELNKFNESDEYLIEIEKKIIELKNISIKIGDKLLEQNEIIDYIDDNTDKLSNKILKMDLEVNKLNHNYRKLEYKNLGKFNFIDTKSGLVLSTNEKYDVILSNTIDMSSTFVIYKTITNLFSIQNLKTQKFLRTDFFGNISFSGNYIGLYEQCFLNLEEIDNNIIGDKHKYKYKSTGICVLSKNFYKGGWLSNPTNIFNIENDENNENNENIINSTSKNFICVEDIIKFELIFVEK